MLDVQVLSAAGPAISEEPAGVLLRFWIEDHHGLRWIVGEVPRFSWSVLCESVLVSWLDAHDPFDCLLSL